MQVCSCKMSIDTRFWKAWNLLKCCLDACHQVLTVYVTVDLMRFHKLIVLGDLFRMGYLSLWFALLHDLCVCNL
jgi:hypothetical protein